MADQYSINISHLSLLMILVELCIIIVGFCLEFLSCHLCLLCRHHLHRPSLRGGFITQPANQICLKHYLLRQLRLGVRKPAVLISQRLLEGIKTFL